MSNFSRKVRRSNNQKKLTSPMRNVFEFCPIELGNNYKFTVDIRSYNSIYFPDSTTFINSYGLVITDYKEFCIRNGHVVDFIEFLKDSVENNPYLSDSIKEINFKVQDEHIYFKYDDEDIDYINMGEFHIDYYKINVCNSYLFITDFIDNKQYMYYGD